MGGSKSGSTGGARGKRTDLRLKREGQGGIFQSDTSCLTPLLLSSVVSLPSSGTFPAHRRALPLWLRCQRKACLSSRLLCPFCLSSSIPVFLSVSDFEYLSPVFSSAASSKVSPNNSALEFYFASLFICILTICVLGFKVLLSGR